MHSIRRERRRILAGTLCLVLLMLWKHSHEECRGSITCSAEDEESSVVFPAEQQQEAQ